MGGIQSEWALLGHSTFSQINNNSQSFTASIIVSHVLQNPVLSRTSTFRLLSKGR